MFGNILVALLAASGVGMIVYLVLHRKALFSTSHPPPQTSPDSHQVTAQILDGLLAILNIRPSSDGSIPIDVHPYLYVHPDQLTELSEYLQALRRHGILSTSNGRAKIDLGALIKTRKRLTSIGRGRVRAF